MQLTKKAASAAFFCLIRKGEVTRGNTQAKHLASGSAEKVVVGKARLQTSPAVFNVFALSVMQLFV